MNKFIISAVTAVAMTAGSAVAAEDQRERESRTGQTAAQPGGADPQVGERAPEAGRRALTGVELVGMGVVGRDGEEIGEITNVLVDEQGQVYSVIMQRGTAVLGIGGDEVAVSFERLQLPEARPGTSEDGRQARIGMTEEQIGELPAYEGEREISDNPRAPGMKPGLRPDAQPGAPSQQR